MSLRTSGHSLKGRLLAFLLAAVLLVTLLLAATTYRGALREADSMFDHYLQQTANTLRGAVPLGLAPVHLVAAHELAHGGVPHVLMVKTA